MIIRCAVTVFFVTFAQAALAAEQSALKRGEALVRKHCGDCHAAGRTGASPQPNAQPLRILERRYPIESLEEALAEGLISGHPEMPEFSFPPADVGAMVAYLKSIQVK